MRSEGRKLGYHVNAGKSWLILKQPENITTAQEIFKDTDINITTEGKRHLGAALGSDDFKTNYIKEKVATWCTEVNNLAEIAKSQPHAAYSAYILGQQHKYRYFLRTLKNIEEELKPLDEVINNVLIPAITGFHLNDAERELVALPVKAGGLNIDVVAANADLEFQRSTTITAPLAAIIALQGDELPDNEARKEIIGNVNKAKLDHLKETTSGVDATLSREMKRSIKQARDPGASSWLSALPLSSQSLY